MAKFCGKCGSKLDEATGLCPKCDADKIKQQTEKSAKPAQKSEEKAVQEKNEPANKKEARKQRKADKKAAKKERKVQKKAAKKAKKKEKWAKKTLGQKFRNILFKMFLWLILIIAFVGGILVSLVYFDFVNIPAISDMLDYIGIVAEDETNLQQTNCLGADFTDILCCG